MREIRLLSSCTREGQLFLCDGEIVNLQYVLRMIFTDAEVSELKLIIQNERFETALSQVKDQMYCDIRNGTDREEYPLKNLNTIPVEIDVKKENIQRINEYTFTIRE